MSLAVFVNTSDGFRDCWAPFFTLFQRYAGSLCSLPIYLNTERKDFQWNGLDIRSTNVWPCHETTRPSWSECLFRGLQNVRETCIIFLLEDYFLDRPVRDELIWETYVKLEKDANAGVVYLNTQGPSCRRSYPAAEGLVTIAPSVKYLVNTQAAIWKKEFLLRQLRRWENAWMFEIFASLRARREPDKFLMIAPKVLSEMPVLEHVHTGIARGKWQTECVPLFRKEGISLDFTHRGFYRRAGRLKYRIEVIRRLIEKPGDALRSIRSLFSQP
jgi:hypothetical protein